MQKAQFKIELRPEPEGGYTALVPALPGCVTYGRTEREARELRRIRSPAAFASLCKHGDPVPTVKERLRPVRPNSD
jgi:antitoxin HicB